MTTTLQTGSNTNLPAIPDYRDLSPENREIIDVFIQNMDFTDSSSIAEFGNKELGTKIEKVTQRMMNNVNPVDAVLETTLKELDISLENFRPEQLANAVKKGAIVVLNKGNSIGRWVKNMIGTPESQDQKDLRESRQTLTEQATEVANIIQQVGKLEKHVSKKIQSNKEALAEQKGLNSSVIQHVIAINEVSKRVEENKTEYTSSLGDDLYQGHYNLLQQKRSSMITQLTILGTYDQSMKMNALNLNTLAVQVQSHKDVSVPLWRYQIGQACEALDIGGIAGKVGRMSEITTEVMGATVDTTLQTSNMVTHAITQNTTPEQAIALFAKMSEGIKECLTKQQIYLESLPARNNALLGQFNEAVANNTVVPALSSNSANLKKLDR